VPTKLASLALVTLVTHATGCSLAFVKKAPPEVPAGAWVECTESKVAPVVDVVFGGSMVLGAVGISQVEDRNREAAQVAGVIYGLAGLGLLYSAFVGFRETGRCDQIHDAAEARGVYGPYPPAPYPYPYPPQPYPYPQPAPGQPYPPAQPAPQPYPQPQPQAPQ